MARARSFRFTSFSVGRARTSFAVFGTVAELCPDTLLRAPRL